MSALRFLIPTVVALTTGAAASADIGTDMQNITRFCLGYIETGQRTNLLMQVGFEQRGRKFKKSYSRSVIGATKPFISVEAQKGNSGYSCSASFGIVSRNTGSSLINIASQSLRQSGYTQTVVTTTRGKRKPAFVKSGVAVELGGSTQVEYSTYSAFIYFQRLN